MPSAVVEPCSPSQLIQLCRQGDNLLAHLYWPKRVNFFEENRQRYLNGQGWAFTATPGHGVRYDGQRPARPTVNFFVADETFAASYHKAAESRGLRYGVLLRRAAVERLARAEGFALSEPDPVHPLARGQTDPREYWRFDIGNRRFGAFAELRFARVVRLATPEAEQLRTVSVAQDAIVAWWQPPDDPNGFKT